MIILTAVLLLFSIGVFMAHAVEAYREFNG
jgi:hypothetical protein